jgi:hypothetical protein
MNKYLTLSNKNLLFPNNSFYDFHCEIDPPLYNYGYDIEVALIRLIITDSRVANVSSGRGGGGGFTARTAEEEEEEKKKEEPLQSLGKSIPSSATALPSAQPPSSPAAATIVTAAAASAPAPPAAAPAPPAAASAPAPAPAPPAPVPNKTSSAVNSLVISNAMDPVDFRAGQFKSMQELYDVVKASLGSSRYLENALKRFSIAAISDQQKLAKYLASNPKQPPKFQIISIPEPRNELITSKGDVIPFPIRLYTSAADLFTTIRLASPSMIAGFNALNDLDAIVSREFPTIQILLKNSPVQQSLATAVAAVRRPVRQAPPPPRFSTLYSLLPPVIPVQCNFIESSQIPSGNAQLLRTVSRGEGAFDQGSWHFNFTSFEYHPVVKNDMKFMRIRFDPSVFDWSLISYNKAYISTLMVLHIRSIGNQSASLLASRHSRKRRSRLSYVRAQNARSNTIPSGVYRGLWSTVHKRSD